MEKLNFPPFEFRFKSSKNTLGIFDPVRKKFVILTPEEWVRQHTLCFLNMTLGYPKSLISVEKEILLNTTRKRYDIIIFNRDGSIHLIVECKAPQIKVDQTTFDQIARYNLKLNATYLMVTNGLSHYYCQMDYDAKKYKFLRDIPSYSR